MTDPSHYGDPSIDRLVAVDACHAALIQALVLSQKPQDLLEIGIGSGASTDAILAALAANGAHRSYTVVDNWLDFGGVLPESVRAKYAQRLRLVTADERDFVGACQERFDFIFSDGDHLHAHEWFERVYNDLLRDGGILIYHDVTNVAMFPNLLGIYHACIEQRIAHYLFNRNSLATERCDRGLLVIFKPAATAAP
jgi:predicted O-methyltransferase YrrM